MPVLVLTPGDCVACFLFPKILPGHSLMFPKAAQEELCVGKTLVLKSTKGTGSASSPLEGSVGGTADIGSLPTENPQVD